MSRYLVERIEAAPNVEVRCLTEVAAAAGDGHLETLTLSDRRTGERENVEAGWLFVFIGASPHTGWLGDDVVRNEHGFVVTGPGLGAGPPGAGRCRGRRTPWSPACPACSRPATSGRTR